MTACCKLPSTFIYHAANLITETSGAGLMAELTAVIIQVAQDKFQTISPNVYALVAPLNQFSASMLVLDLAHQIKAWGDETKRSTYAFVSLVSMTALRLLNLLKTAYDFQLLPFSEALNAIGRLPLFSIAVPAALLGVVGLSLESLDHIDRLKESKQKRIECRHIRRLWQINCEYLEGKINNKGVVFASDEFNHIAEELKNVKLGPYESIADDSKVSSDELQKALRGQLEFDLYYDYETAETVLKNPAELQQKTIDAHNNTGKKDLQILFNRAVMLWSTLEQNCVTQARISALTVIANFARTAFFIGGLVASPQVILVLGFCAASTAICKLLYVNANKKLVLPLPLTVTDYDNALTAQARPVIPATPATPSPGSSPVGSPVEGGDRRVSTLSQTPSEAAFVASHPASGGGGAGAVSPQPLAFTIG